ncbi:amidohydrolase family protein [Halomicrobium urmianum]|uniref:amidohydrolase family protein n=1 Tax=Halomicrobium urmianum TaxID=1586233 RepID=UPI001CD94444|nr:amidohydrolase family protein [Halomicrobium urmianum]
MTSRSTAPAYSLGDEVGSVEPGKCADLIVLDVDTPKFTPLINVPAHVVNNAAPTDVETVIVDGDVVVWDETVRTVDADAVQRRAEHAVDRFADETDWDLDIGGGEPPGTVDTVRDIPKRGPVQRLSRLAVQSVRDSVPF